jgi:hypothetical protein
VKKVVLKSDCKTGVSAAPNMIEGTTHTEEKVAGRKTMVKSAMDLTTVLSWWTMLLKACTPVSFPPSPSF